VAHFGQYPRPSVACVSSRFRFTETAKVGRAPTPLAVSGEIAGRLAAEKPDARRMERGTGRGQGTNNKTAALRSI